MRSLLLAGGFRSRLRPVTDKLPKCLVPINGRPLLEYWLNMLITSAMTLASGGNIWEAACLGSLAAAVQVGRVGNTPIRADELMREIIR